MYFVLTHIVHSCPQRYCTEISNTHTVVYSSTQYTGTPPPTQGVLVVHRIPYYPYKTQDPQYCRYHYYTKVDHWPWTQQKNRLDQDYHLTSIAAAISKHHLSQQVIEAPPTSFIALTIMVSSLWIEPSGTISDDIQSVYRSSKQIDVFCTRLIQDSIFSATKQTRANALIQVVSFNKSTCPTRQEKNNRVHYFC